jgi:hypothetical protein
VPLPGIILARCLEDHKLRGAQRGLVVVVRDGGTMKIGVGSTNVGVVRLVAVASTAAAIGFNVRFPLRPMSGSGLGCVKTCAEQKWPQLPDYFDAPTFDAFRFLSSKMKISNVRELGHEFSHSLGQIQTLPREGLAGRRRSPPLECSIPSMMFALAVGGATAPNSAPVAQLDRVPGYEPGGRGFESLRARQLQRLSIAALTFNSGL